LEELLVLSEKKEAGKLDKEKNKVLSKKSYKVMKKERIVTKK
jgi:hypothetical protein